MNLRTQTRPPRNIEPELRPPAGTASGQPTEPDCQPERLERSVLVSHGIHRGHFPVAGLHIRDARQTLARLLNIDPASVPVINGRVVDEDTIIGEDIAMLSFVKPSALRGAAPERITLRDGEAQVTGGDGASTRATLSGFSRGITHASVVGLDDESIPDHVKWQVRCSQLTVCIVELSPALRPLKWIDEQHSPVPFGPNATYQERRLATPYVVLKVPFLKGRLVSRVELFYRNGPLRRLDDELYWCNLLNVSPNAYGCTAWVCIQYLKSERIGSGITNGLDALVHHLWGGGLNRSSEEHEGSSAFSKCQQDAVDPRVTDVERWEAESVLDPRFVLGVPWKPAGMTVRRLIESELNYHGVVRNFDSVAEWVAVLMGSRNGRKGDS
jgi:hypothetical protein